jgi:hypothetical protein
MNAAQIIDRDQKGRFRPGSSGNLTGKKPGTRNRATLLKEALRDGEGTTVARVVIDKALAGDAVTARFLLARLEPKPRGRPIHLEIPEGESPAGEVVATFNAALRAMAAGEITPDEAVSVARFLEGRMRVLKAWQLEQKLTRWDSSLPIPGDDRPSPIPYLPPKPTHISSPPARGEKDAKGWRGKAEPYPKLDEGAASACKMAETPGTNPSAGAAHPHPAPAKLGSASLSLRNLLPQAGEGGPSMGRADAESPPLFSPHLRSLIEAGMANPEDNRWLAALDEEWGLKGRLTLHFPCNSQGAASQAAPPAPQPASSSSPPAKAKKDPQGCRGEGNMKAHLKSATHLHPPSISRPPIGPSIGWEQRVPPRSARPTPRVITRRPYP